jgi:predicted RNA-binding Zn ribbon-like protein
MELREAIWRVFLALSRGKNASAADIERINDELGPALSHARVHKHGDGFHWDWNDDIALDTPLWIPARATAELLIEGKFDRLHSCASPTCGWLFLDQTRNNSRRWCDMKGCGNRAKVRRFRAQS